SRRRRNRGWPRGHGRSAHRADAAAPGPAEGAFRNPAAGLYDELALARLRADQLDGARRRPGGAGPGTRAAGVAEREARPGTARSPPRRDPAVAVAEVGGRGSGEAQAPIGAHRRVALAPDHTPGGVEATRRPATPAPPDRTACASTTAAVGEAPCPVR